MLPCPRQTAIVLMISLPIVGVRTEWMCKFITDSGDIAVLMGDN